MYVTCCGVFFFIFFFKQKTAYEMRISDWSSDVCSSDLGGSRRLFIDMPSDPRLAACETEELRLRFGRVGTLTVLCTLPLNGQLARHRQVAQLFASEFDGYVLTHAGETLPPGAAVHMLLESEIGRASWRERGWQYG